ncbi:hypothetical protein FGB62_45g01 [Gracilaria domingensis]|nr:hypothetical protein FGB62_45g01 [Gracilaria domingensis]
MTGEVMGCVFSAADAARVGASCRGGGGGGGVRVIRRHGSGWRGAADLRRKVRAAAARRQLVVLFAGVDVGLVVVNVENGDVLGT